MFDKENGIVTLCRAIDPRNKIMMTDTVKLVAAVSLLEEGYVYAAFLAFKMFGLSDYMLSKRLLKSCVYTYLVVVYCSH